MITPTESGLYALTKLFFRFANEKKLHEPFKTGALPVNGQRAGGAEASSIRSLVQKIYSVNLEKVLFY